MAHCTNKAGIMPCVAKSFNKFVSCLNREVTAMALCAEECNIIFLTIRLTILHMEETVSKGLSTSRTHKAGGVPGLPECMHHFSHDLGVAAGTGRCKELSIAVFTVNIILLLHKADISQRRVAVLAVELLRMPGTTQCHQEWSPDDVVAGSTQRCSVAGCIPLCLLSNSTSHGWEGGRVECRAGCSRSGNRNGSMDGVRDVG